MSDIKDAETVNQVEECSKEINAILEKYGLAIAVSPPQPILVPKSMMEKPKSPVVKP